MMRQAEKNNAIPILIISVGRWVGAVAVILVVGCLDLLALFSDLGPGESVLWLVATTGTIQVIGGVAIGCLLPHRWYLAVGEAWGAVLIGLALSLVTLAQGFESTRILVIALCLLVIPGISLLAGRLDRKSTRLNSSHT